MIAWLVLLACGGCPDETRKSRHQAGPEDAIPGRFKPITRTPDEDLEALAALGYVDGSRPPPNEAGVWIGDRDRIQPGANLYVSGQGPEAHLVDIEGNVLHKWAYDWFDQWEEPERHSKGEFPNHWRRAHLFDNGDLIAIWGGQGMVKLDKDSRFLWGIGDRHVHHDLDIAPDGSIWTLTRAPTVIPAIAEHKVVMDSVLVLEPDGSVREEFSVFQCFENSPFARWIPFMKKRGDVLHTNTIAILGEGFERPEFKAGNLLVSFRHVDALATIDPVERRVEWVLRGSWNAQHQPVLLDDDTVLLFDNRGLGKRSRVIEVDTRSGAVKWSYGADDGEYFYSRLLGSVQRLDNGNTLISESDNGRAFEITREGERVWELVNPHRAGEDDQFIASLYELVRLPPDQDLSWADPTTAERSVKARHRP